jgi:hypothetical protein
MDVARLSVLCNGSLYPPGDTPGTHFCYILSRSQGHSAAERIVNEKRRWSYRKSNPGLSDLYRGILVEGKHKDCFLITYNFVGSGIFIKLKETWLPPFSEYKNNLLCWKRIIQNPQPSLIAPHCGIQPHPKQYFNNELLL